MMIKMCVTITFQKANMIALQNVHIGEEEMCDDVVSPRWKRPYEVIASINHRNLVTADDGKQHKYPNAKVRFPNI